MAFTKATKKQSRLRLGLCGPSGSGKTFTALRIATGLCAAGKRVALIDSERGSASLYAGRFDFDVAELPDFRVQTYTRLLHMAESGGGNYDVAILDSISHAWAGKGGLLEQVDNAKGDQRNKFTAWRDVTPQHHDFIDAMLQSPLHIIATMRAKTEYVLEEDDKGRKVPRKVGMAPVQRDGMEYEFTLVGDLDGATLRVSKTRIPEVVGLGAVIREPGEDLGKRLAEWMATGAAPATKSDPAIKSVYEQALALIRGAEAPGKVHEVMKRAAPKVLPEELVQLEAAAEARLNVLRGPPRELPDGANDAMRGDDEQPSHDYPNGGTAPGDE